jgi:hypothetical protein
MKDKGLASLGDKVQITKGPRRGDRGTIAQIGPDAALVDLDNEAVSVPLDWTRNFSLAARKAWRTRPDRAAGRPRDPELPRKRMVSLRIEVDLWDALGKAAEGGLIRSREAAVNEWLREKLNGLREEVDGSRHSHD